MRPPGSYPWETLLGAGRSPQDQFALLAEARCLSEKGRAARSAVVARIEEVTTSWQPVEIPDFLLTPGYEPPTLWSALADTLWEAGYLDGAGCQELRNNMDPEYAYVRRIIAAVRATDIDCRGCRRSLPASATFCGYCGRRQQT